MKNCVVLEMENHVDFENALNKWLAAGYKMVSSSCNSKYYKAILISNETDMFDSFLAQERLGTPDIDCDVPNKK